MLFLLGYNYSFWAQIAAAYPWNFANAPFLCSLAILVFSLHYLFFSFLAFKYCLKPIVLFIISGAAIAAYFMDSFGYIISSQTFSNVVDTDSKEVQDLLCFKLGMYLVFLSIVPSLLVIFTNVTYPRLKQRLVYLLIAVLAIVVNIGVFNKNYVSFLRNHKQARYYLNPIRPVYSLVKFIFLQFKNTGNTSFNILDHAPTLAAHSGKPRLVILVVGESDRAHNFSLNGYNRPTNPLLAARPDVYSFNQFYSCGTETTVSVPCMFSAFKRTDFSYEKGRYTENVLDILQKSKVQVIWRDNDGGCKNVCDRVLVDDLNNATTQPFCNSFECHDEILLHQLENYIQNNPGDKIIVLHKKGNHGPAYYKRYPTRFEKFTPTCKSNELQDCSDQDIVNAYDNIVVYTDYFLDKLIKQLEQNTDYQTAMIYVSDHGESLGENGIYLHAMPYWIAPKEQIHIPFIVWASKDFDLDRQRLLNITANPYSHDNLFHTLLGLFKVQTVAYDRSLDIFAEK